MVRETNQVNCTLQTANSNCSYILLAYLLWPGDSEGTFRSSSQAATCPPVYHTRRRLLTVPLIAERQAGKLWMPSFIIFGLPRHGIEPKSTVSVADFSIHSTTDRQNRISLRRSVVVDPQREHILVQYLWRSLQGKKRLCFTWFYRTLLGAVSISF